MKIKPHTYYKDYFDDIKEYDIIYTDDTNYYLIAYKYNGELIKHDNRIEWDSIKSLQKEIDKDKNINKTLTEISKEDVFLELL